MNLQEPYNRDAFLGFLKEFIPSFDEDTRSAFVDNLKVTINAEYLGESDDLDLAVFALTHSSSADARVSLSMDGFKLMKKSAVYRALIVYRSENSNDWRFSLMTATPDLDEKGKIIRKLSNPRRFSFFLGPNAKINTPYQFLIKQGAVKDFDDLQKRFSLEVVNKEFYKQISEKFTQLVGGTLGNGKKQKTYKPLIKLPSQSPESQLNMGFGVRLIGRIIFCWFLREKKSADDISLMPNELLSLEAVSKHNNYYHGVLEPIFFEVLNKEQRSRREEFSGNPYSFIPYLNGGLFSPHEDDYYKRPNGEQSIYHNTLVVPDEWLKDLFEILETYNFTIDENTSFDEELSIDPEMLGRIFENLLAEINPETGESARKSTGSYYTPRVIVDYMVDESILLYLQEHTKIAEDKLRAIISYDLSDDEEHPLTEGEKMQIVEHLSKLKLLDPACGSGAFPIGALQKIVFVLQQIDPHGEYWLQKQLEGAHPEFRRDIEKKFSNKELDFLRKLGIIRECIFGVDIQPIATEIARLRCFLTLIVEERIDDSADNRGIKPLPNLDFKFVTANSLIDLPTIEDEAEQIQMFDDREKIDDLKSIRDQFFNSNGLEREKLKAEFVTAQNRLIHQLREEHGWIGVSKAELSNKLTSWEPFTHKASDWFDPEWMFGIKDGFDIVIANPPYVGEKGYKQLFQDVKNNSSLGVFYKRKMDLFYFFFHLAINLSKNRGIVSFISTNYYITADGALKLRSDFKSRGSFVKLLNFNELKIFESAKGQHNMISIIQKKYQAECVAETFITKQEGYANSLTLESILHHRDSETDYFRIEQDNLYEGENNYLRLSGNTNVDNPIQSICSKIEDQGDQLINICNVSQGLLTGVEKITSRHIENKLVSADLLKHGVYCLTEDELKVIDPSEKEKNIIFPFFKNSDIKRYWTNCEPDQFVLYATRDLHIEEYPNIFSHFKRFEKVIKARSQDRGEMQAAMKMGKWWVIFAAREKDVFLSPKIICPQRAAMNTFGYNECPWFAASDVYYITQKDRCIDLKYVLALLNSKLYFYWLLHKGKKKGKNLELLYTPLSQIPLKKAEDLVQKRFVKISDYILGITKSKDFPRREELKNKVKEYERQIDEMVYELYELTPEEIEIVENAGK